MPIAIHIGRILVKLCLYFLRIIQHIRKPPLLYDIDGASACLNRSFLPEQIERLLQIGRIHIGGSLDNTIGTILKSDQGNAKIFRLNIRVFQPVCHPHNAVYLIPHHPAQKINIMNTLIHQRTAVLLPGAAPLRPGIILIIPGPANMCCPMKHPSKAVHLHRLTDFLDGLVKTVLVAGTDLHTLLLRRLYNPVRISQ